MKIIFTLASPSFRTPAAAGPVARPPAFGVCGADHQVEKGAPSGLGSTLLGIARDEPGKVADLLFRCDEEIRDHTGQAAWGRLYYHGPPNNHWWPKEQASGRGNRRLYPIAKSKNDTRCCQSRIGHLGCSAQTSSGGE